MRPSPVRATLALGLSAVLISGLVAPATASGRMPVTPASTAGFADVPPDHRFHEAVTWLVEQGITTGTTPTTFAPSAEITRSQMAVFLWRYRGSPAADHDHGFEDVPAGAAYEQAVSWLAESGITGGISDDQFGPSHPVTRQQMAAFLWRLSGYPRAWSPMFSDVAYDSAFRPAITWLVDAGVTTGVTETTFEPSQAVTRGQMAAFLHRLSDSQVRIVHVVAAGQQPVPDIDAAIRHEVDLLDDWFKEQTGGPSLRWETGDDGQVAVEVVQLPGSLEQLEDRMELLDQLVAAGLDRPNDVYLVYADVDAGTCGYSYRSFAILSMRTCHYPSRGHYPSLNSRSVGYGAPYLALHELVHALGAVPPCAPNYDGTGHHKGDNRDVLYSGMDRDHSNMMLDPGHVEYYGHGREGCTDIAGHPVWTR